jgi:hypothetical protein
MELFQVGSHVVKVSSAQGRWAVVVDETALERWFTNRAEAWTAGVREADRIDASRRALDGSPSQRAG